MNDTMNRDQMVASLREQIEVVSEMLTKAAPNQFNFNKWLWDNGEAMGPNIALPKGERMGTKGECFRNSAVALFHLQTDGWVYCEGKAIRDDLGLALDHAWLANDKGEVLDLTWRGKPGCAAYYGVPFKTRYLNETLTRTGYYGLFGGKAGMGNRELFEDSPEMFRAWPKESDDGQCADRSEEAPTEAVA